MKLDSAIFAIVNAVLYVRHFGLVVRYARHNRRFPNIANPKTYTERMFWRKAIDHNPQFITFSDKLATKAYLRERCPDLAIPQTLWEGGDSDEIPDALLHGDVLVKANHGCQYNYRVRTRPCDRGALRHLTQKWLRRVYGRRLGEWGYHKVKPVLYVEEAIGDAERDLIEFNIRAGSGKPILGSVMGKCKQADQWAFYLDAAGDPVTGMSDPEGSPPQPLPPGFSALEPYRQAVKFTEKLSMGVDYARFDFMWNGRQLFGGEITLYPAGGMSDPHNTVCHIATLNGWDLLQSHFLRRPQSGWKAVYAAALRRQLKRTPHAYSETNRASS